MIPLHCFSHPMLWCTCQSSLCITSHVKERKRKGIKGVFFLCYNCMVTLLGPRVFWFKNPGSLAHIQTTHYSLPNKGVKGVASTSLPAWSQLPWAQVEAVTQTARGTSPVIYLNPMIKMVQKMQNLVEFPERSHFSPCNNSKSFLSD